MLNGRRFAWRRRADGIVVARIAVIRRHSCGAGPGDRDRDRGQRAARHQRHRPGGAGRRGESPAVGAARRTATTAAANVNCDIIVPANPLSAQGLATPYQLTGPNGMTPAQSGCKMTNAVNLGAFVQATILNPATGQLSVYDPLVITQGTTAGRGARRCRPCRRTRSSRSTSGSTAPTCSQVGATRERAQQGNCVNGTAGSIFGQVSFCNGINFFNAAFQVEREGRLVVPSAGHLGQDRRVRRRAGDRPDLPGHAQLRHGRPGPVRQRDHLVPAQSGHRPDRAGHRGQRGEHPGLHAARQRQ